MTILVGWRQQYDRMLRTHARLVALATGKQGTSSEEAADALIHFFQDAFHLGDWLVNDQETNTSQAEIHGSGQPACPGLLRSKTALAICVDLANGSKHFTRTRTRTGDPSTAVTSQSVTIFAPTAGSSDPIQSPQTSWTVESNDQTYDALTLVDQVIKEWDAFLKTKGLLSE